MHVETQMNRALSGCKEKDPSTASTFSGSSVVQHPEITTSTCFSGSVESNQTAENGCTWEGEPTVDAASLAVIARIVRTAEERIKAGKSAASSVPPG